MKPPEKEHLKVSIEKIIKDAHQDRTLSPSGAIDTGARGLARYIFNLFGWEIPSSLKEAYNGTNNNPESSVSGKGGTPQDN